jgi:hypothetical protein
MPSVLGYWWRTDKGETVLLAANLSDEVRTVRYRPFGKTAAARTECSPNQTLTLAPHELRRVASR